MKYKIEDIVTVLPPDETWGFNGCDGVINHPGKSYDWHVLIEGEAYPYNEDELVLKIRPGTQLQFSFMDDAETN